MTVTFEVKAQAGKVKELHQTLEALLPGMRDEKGCRVCHVSRGVEDGEVFVLFSDWESRGSYERYINSDDGCALLGALKLLSESARFCTSNYARWEEVKTVTLKDRREVTLQSSQVKKIDSKELISRRKKT